MLAAIKKLEESEEFKQFKEENPDAFLVHVFYMLDEANANSTQVGYYSKKTDKITTFIVEPDLITRNPEAEVFKEQETLMNPLDLKILKIDIKDAVAIAEKLRQEKYKDQVPLKNIAILQHLDVGQVWNITFVTQSFKTLNIKINSTSGEIVSDKLVAIIEFGK